MHVAEFVEKIKLADLRLIPEPADLDGNFYSELSGQTSRVEKDIVGKKNGEFIHTLNHGIFILFDKWAGFNI